MSDAIYLAGLCFFIPQKTGLNISNKTFRPVLFFLSNESQNILTESVLFLRDLIELGIDCKKLFL